MYVPFHKPDGVRIHAFIPTHTVPLGENVNIMLTIQCGKKVHLHSLHGFIIADDFDYGILISIEDTELDSVCTPEKPDSVCFSVSKDENYCIIDNNEDIVFSGESVIGEWVNAAYCFREKEHGWKFTLGDDTCPYNRLTDNIVTGFKVCLCVEPEFLFN